MKDKRDEVLSSRNNDIDQELIRTNPITLKKEIDESIPVATVPKSFIENLFISIVNFSVKQASLLKVHL